MALGTPHLHLTTVGSTNDRARELAQDGAPHGTTVTADEQTAGRGRHGRTWAAPRGKALLLSVVLRDAPELLTLRAAVAVAIACGDKATIKWPNDILVADRTAFSTSSSSSTGKVAGILCEQRPGEDWAVAGIGVNVAVDVDLLEPELRVTAGTLGLPASEITAVRAQVLEELERALALADADLIAAWTERDCLLGRAIEWKGGSGTAAGIDAEGRLLVENGADQIQLDSGEVSLVRSA
jgi:BirA family biotin operon repressor/biotin-[acetyl-CoA-carboxylase] ligase